MTTKLTFSFPVDAILLLGPTGAGKSPLGDMIASRGFLCRKAHHMDFGSELRSIALGNGPSVHYSDSEIDFVHGVLERGLLLENEHFILARKIITLYLVRTGFRAGDVLVLNGLPRHTGQAKDISTLATIHALVVLDCTADSIYHRLSHNIGGDRSERVDDDRDLVAKKLQIFIERTAPLIEYYREICSRIYHIPVTDTSATEDAYSLLSSLSSANPPFSLVAEPPKR